MTLAKNFKSRRWQFVLYLATTLFAAATEGSVLQIHPEDLAVDEGSVAVFNCTVQCRYTIYWSVGSHDAYTRTITINDQNRLELFQRTTGIVADLVSIPSDCDDDFVNGAKTQQLRIHATASSNETAVQCFAADLNSNAESSDIFFSRYAVLIVQGETPEPTPSPCPSPEPIIVTSVVTKEPSTSTVTVTVTPTPVVVTKVVTLTTGLPSKTPCANEPTIDSNASSTAVARLLRIPSLVVFVLPLLVAALGF